MVFHKNNDFRKSVYANNDLTHLLNYYPIHHLGITSIKWVKRKLKRD